MVTLSLLVGAVVLVGLLVLLGRAFLRAYLKFRGERVITCPENQRPAGVRVDARYAGWTNMQGSPDLRLQTCSRWPELQNCGQECLQQIAAAPEDCLVRNMLTRWYAGKNCAVCGKPIGEIHWADHKPALIDAAHRTVQWQDVPAQSLAEALASHQPVCWNCHVVSSLMTQHPELVVDRSRHI